MKFRDGQHFRNDSPNNTAELVSIADAIAIG